MLLFTSLTTIFISFVLLLHNWKLNKNVVYLSIMFILTSLFGLGHYFMTTGNSSFWLAVFFNHFAPFMLLIGPFLYFYVRNTLLDTTTACKKDCIHSIPALVALFGSLEYFIMPFDQKIIIADRIIKNLDIIRTINVNYFYDIGQSFALRCFFALAYLIYCVYLMFKTSLLEINGNNVPRKQFLITYRWLIILLTSLLFIFISFTFLALHSANSIPSKTIKDGYVMYLMAGIAYCIMSFSLLLFPEILYGIPRKVNFISVEKKKEKEEIDIREDPFFDLYNSILKYLEEEKPFLSFDFALSDISLYLKVPQNHVSYCINCLMGKKFSKLKTELRIKHAVELLKNGTHSLLTIEAISEKAGFKSRSNFYSSFKEETGYTPSEYLEKFHK